MNGLTYLYKDQDLLNPSEHLQISSDGFADDLSLEELWTLIDIKSPEIPKLLDDIKSKLGYIFNELEPITESLQELSTTDNHQSIKVLKTKGRLLLGYLCYLSYYIFMKCNGAITQNHPVITRLIEFRNLIEKLRPIEKKIQYQFSKLLNNRDHEKKKNGIKPMPERLIDPQFDNNTSKEIDGPRVQMTYLQPKLLPVEYTNTHLSLMEKLDLENKRRSKRFKRSSLVQSFKSQLEGHPEEFYMDNYSLIDSTKLLDDQDLLKLSTSGNHFQAKHQARKRKAIVGTNELDELVKYAGQIGEAHTSEDPEKIKKRSKYEDLKKHMVSIANHKDAEKNSTELASKLDKVVHNKSLLKRASSDNLASHSFDETSELLNSHEDSVTELFSEFENERQHKKENKIKNLTNRSKAAIPSLNQKIPLNSKRATNAVIDDNKGLTKKRKPIEGNSRVHYRLKHQKKMKRFKYSHSQLKETTANYEGEGTGIKSHLATSLTIQ